MATTPRTLDVVLTTNTNSVVDAMRTMNTVCEEYRQENAELRTQLDRQIFTADLIETIATRILETEQIIRDNVTIDHVRAAVNVWLRAVAKQIATDPAYYIYGANDYEHLCASVYETAIEGE